MKCALHSKVSSAGYTSFRLQFSQTAAVSHFLGWNKNAVRFMCTCEGVCVCTLWQYRMFRDRSAGQQRAEPPRHREWKCRRFRSDRPTARPPDAQPAARPPDRPIASRRPQLNLSLLFFLTCHTTRSDDLELCFRKCGRHFMLPVTRFAISMIGVVSSLHLISYHISCDCLEWWHCSAYWSLFK